MMRCAKFEMIGKRPHLSTKRGVENVTTSDRVNKKNDNSPQRCQGQSASSHSTPIAKEQNVHADAEESPDLDYSPSPILLPFTQEGGNEVAWDWQSSTSRTPVSTRQNVQCETPKRTKLLQRKRNSNSPLLYKPLKRKTIKMENIENIGKFAAELQALNEKMRVIKSNDKSRPNDCVKEEDMPTNISSKEKMSEIKDDKQTSVGGSGNDNEQNNIERTNDHDTVSEKVTSESYEDLFDDSVDDDMIRCTQEIEEKFNLMMDKGNSAHSQVKGEESCSNDISNKTSVQFDSNKDCRKPLVKDILDASDSNTLKTYSKLSSKRDASVCVGAQRSKDSYKPCLNNNNTIHSCTKKPCDSKKLSKSDIVDLCDFADDSFDDWFATCVEEEKLVSDGSSTHRDESMKFQPNYKGLTNAPLKSQVKSADSLKPMAKPETSNLENRKFFKTKSLSDQYVNRDAITNVKGTTNASYYATKPMLQHLNSSRGSIPHTNVARVPVSTKSIVTNDRKVENNAISLMRGTDRTHGSDVNRCAVKSVGDRFVKHHSTGNMKNDTQEMTKTGSQPTRCTAEEIERKRLQALARLGAKKKLYFTKIASSINR